jgi:acetyl esterase/lipase
MACLTAQGAICEPLQIIDVHHNVPYVVNGGHSRTLDIFRPKVSLEDKVPVVVFIHGGGWSGGNKEDCNPSPLTMQGLAVVSINYRLSREAKWPAQIHDCKAAIRWIRAHAREYGLNGEEIGVWGPSAGGHLAAMLGTTSGIKALEGTEGNLDQSSEVQAVCDLFGPSDLSQMVKNSRFGKTAVLALLGSDNKILERIASPVYYAHHKAPPFLIMHGDRDAVIASEQSLALAIALQKAGNQVTVKLVPGAGHGIGFDTPEFSVVASFFKKNLQ